MIDPLLQIVAPHHCYGCGEIGRPLCDNCKYDIVSEPFYGCIVCRRPVSSGICRTCRTYYLEAWCVGERHEALGSLIDDLKFSRMKAAAGTLADLLHQVLPILPPDTVVVPVPTIPHHIRTRGYGQVELIAKALARSRGLTYQPVLVRRGGDVQHGATRAQRFAQAKRAFRVRGDIDESRPYLIVDDIVTTGATLQFTAKTLHDAGVRTIFVAALAKQPLDK